MLKELFNPYSYYFNPYAVPVTLAAIFVLLIGAFVLNQNRRAILNIAFFYKCFAISFWLFTISIVYSCRSPGLALFWYRYFTFFGVINIMPSLILFAIVWAGKLKEKKRLVITNYIISFVFYGLVVGTDKLISTHDIRSYFWGFYPKYSFWAVPFLIFFLIQIAISFGNLYAGYKSESVPLKRTQRKLIAIASLIGFTASVDFLPKLFNIPLYPYGYFSLFLYISIIAYCIVKYRAFDIETVIHKTVMWLFTFSFIIIPILLLYWRVLPQIRGSAALQAGFWMASFFLLAFYLRVIQPKIDHFFQRRKSDLEEISNQFISDLVHLKGLNQLIKRIHDTIADTLYPEHIGIHIYNENTKTYKLSYSLNDDWMPGELKIDDKMLALFIKNNRIIHREFVDIDPVYASVRQELNKYFDFTQATLLIPLALNDRLLGIISLGRKSNLARYSATDFHFLTTLKNQSTVAISNSLVYENIEEQVRQRTNELFETQRQLIQAEKLATMGTLAGGVAHEINNPLTAVLTNVQMLLDGNNTLDVDSKESLELIEEATKRCRTIVQKLMAYAKKPLAPAHMSRVDLLKAVQNVVAFLGYQLEQENIKIAANSKNGSYIVLGNQNELEQVFTNLILNARDAIRHVKKTGTIRVNIYEKGDSINAEVCDDGCGITKDVMSKIFDPFFTTKDVGKGVGLGLSICQSIIEKHRGSLSVQTQIGRGSTFAITLPK